MVRPFTRADVQPQLTMLTRLVGKHGIWSVDLVGSVERFGESEHDVDILVVVDPRELGLVRDQWEGSDNGWSMDDGFIDPPPSPGATLKLDSFRRAIIDALETAGCPEPVWDRDIVNVGCDVNGRIVPTDVFIGAAEKPGPRTRKPRQSQDVLTELDRFEQDRKQGRLA